MRHNLPNLKPVFQSNSKNLTSTKASPNFLPSGASHLSLIFSTSNDFSSLMISSSRHFQALHCCNFSGTKDFTSGTLCSKFKPINLSGKIKNSPPQLLCKRATGTSSSSIFRPNSRARMVTSKFNQGQSISETTNKNRNNNKCGAFLCTSVPPKSSRGSGLDSFDKFSWKSVSEVFLGLEVCFFCLSLSFQLCESFFLGFFDNLWEFHTRPWYQWISCSIYCWVFSDLSEKNEIPEHFEHL